MEPTRIYRIVTHHWPHLDEVLAITLLKRFGEKKYPGVRDARVEYCSTGKEPEGKSWESHLKEGTILVGIGGGPFDEHATPLMPRKGVHSASSLVADDLRVREHPVWKRLIELATEADREGVHPLHIANQLKLVYRLNPEKPEMGINFAKECIGRLCEEQQMFLNAQRELHALSGTASHRTVSRESGPDLDIVAVESDNFTMGKASRSIGIAILIQRQKSGHTQVFTDSVKHKLNLRYVVSELRKAELRAKGWSKDDLAKVGSKALSAEGSSIDSIWYYQTPGENLLNGSETTPDRKPTRLSLESILKIVAKNIFAEPVAKRPEKELVA